MPAVGGPGAAPRRGRVRGATWTAENRLRFWAESDGGTVTSTLCARGIKWVRLGKNQGDGELHFVGCGKDKSLALRGGIDLDGDGVVSHDEMRPITEATIQEWIDEADDDMQAWTVFCNTHCAWTVADLTPIVAALELDSKPFFGPVRRGVATSTPSMRRVPSRRCGAPTACSSSTSSCPTTTTSRSTRSRSTAR